MIEAVDQCLSEVDLVTGGTVESVACPRGTPVAKCGSILVFKDAESGDPVLGFDIESGGVRWERQLFAELRSLGIDEQYPVLVVVGEDEDRLVVARGAHLVAVGARDGRILWHASVSVPYGAAHVSQGRVYAWSAGVTSRRTTFDMAAGVVVRDESCFVDSSHLVVLEETTGNVVLKNTLSGYGGEFRRNQEVNPGAVGRRHVVFSTRSGLLAVFRLSDGELVLKEQFPDQLSRPAVDGREIFLTCSTGRLEVIECTEDV